jgi:hypothetical protein
MCSQNFCVYLQPSPSRFVGFNELLGFLEFLDLLGFRGSLGRWILSSKGGPMNNNESNIVTTSPEESSSSERWDLSDCVLAAPWYHFQQ